MLIEDFRTFEMIEALNTARSDIKYDLYKRLIELDVKKVPLKVGDFWTCHCDIMLTTRTDPVWSSQSTNKDNLSRWVTSMKTADPFFAHMAGFNFLLKEFRENEVFVTLKVKQIKATFFHIFEDNDPFTVDDFIRTFRAPN